MTDERHRRAICDLAVERLLEVHGGILDDLPPDPVLPPDLRIIYIGEAVVYVGSDPGEPTTGRPADPDALLLSSCAAIDVADTGAAAVLVHEFRTDPATPADLRIATTLATVPGMGSMVWIDQPLPAATSFDVVAATLDEFVGHALRLRELLAPLDRSTSDEAVERAESGLHAGALSYDLIDSSDWKDHAWLSEIVQNSDIDCDRYFCLYGLSNSAAAQFRDVTLEFERADGTWDSVRPQLPGPHMPARYYEQPSVAWYDANDRGPGPGQPDSPTGRRRARIPTGWTGPPK